MLRYAFTTRIPLAVLITLGVKRWENRACLPTPQVGKCLMTCSKNSSPQEYKVFQQWGQRVLPKEISLLIPTWEMVENWRGKGVAVCDYTATTNSGPMIWNEGYPYWWELSNVHLLQCPIPCKGNVGMWVMSPELSSEVEVQLAKL